MDVSVDVPPAGPTYVYLSTVSRHFGAETKTNAVKMIINELERC